MVSVSLLFVAMAVQIVSVGEDVPAKGVVACWLVVVVAVDILAALQFYESLA